ncbi:MAG: hypothetical protein ABSG04_06495, partial [Verrucomicrobiota bacterium]
SAADYQNVLLTLTSDAAVNYFILRSLDTEIAHLQHTIELREQSVEILKGRSRQFIPPWRKRLHGNVLQQDHEERPLGGSLFSLTVGC